VRLSLINAHGGMQTSATPKGRSFAQTLPRGSVLSFKEGSGNQTNNALAFGSCIISPSTVTTSHSCTN